MNPFFKINQAEADEIIEYVKEQAALKKLKKVWSVFEWYFDLWNLRTF